MQISKYLCVCRGMGHLNHCEDFALMMTKDNWQIGVVADGCSSGRDSHFAAVLTCKLLRKCVTKVNFDENPDIEAIGLALLAAWLNELKAVAKMLLLETEELLSTLLLLLYDKQNDEARIWVLGDGLVAINDQIKEIDHDNMPDYPAYHLADNAEQLNAYFTKQTFAVKKPQKIAISTDGAASFQSNGQLTASEGQQLAMSYLLNDMPFAKITNMLNRQVNILLNQHGLVPYDDLGIIKYFFSREVNS